MSDRELIKYYANRGVEILLSDDEVEEGDDTLIETELSRLEAEWGDNTKNNPELLVLDALLAVTDLVVESRNYLCFLCLKLTDRRTNRSLGAIRSELKNGSISENLIIAFDRARRILESRYVSRAYPAARNKVVNLKTPSWLKPGVYEFPEGSRLAIHRPEAFGLDFSLCAEYLKLRGLIPVCDMSVKAILLRGAEDCPHQEFLEIFDNALFASIPVLNRLCMDISNIVWISCGTQFGLPLGYSECRIDEGYFRDRLYGIVGASALNRGYAGLHIYTWNRRDAGGEVHGYEIAHFKNGGVSFADTMKVETNHV